MIALLLWLLLIFVIILHFRQSKLRSDLEATQKRLWRLETQGYRKLDDEIARDAGPSSAPASETEAAASTALPSPSTPAPTPPLSSPRTPAPDVSPPKADRSTRVDMPKAALDLPRKAKSPTTEAATPASLKPGSTTATPRPPAASSTPTPPRPPAAGLATPPPAGKPKPRSTGIEEMLGTRLYVWLGAIALSLAGIFLVRYAIDQGWLIPEIRTTLGTLFGLSLLGAGERLRKVPRIGAALSAAGIAVLFASFYAATILYTLIPPLAGFLLMGLCGLAGIALALRQGQIVAVVGLIGSYLTPQLVQPSSEPSRMLFVYLMVLLLATLAVSRQRDWWTLAGSSLFAGLLWAMLWSTAPLRPGDSIWLGLFVFGSLLAYLLASWPSTGDGWHADGLDPSGSDKAGSQSDAPVAETATRSWQRILGNLALGASMLAQMQVLLAAGYDGNSWTFIGLIGATALVLARLREDYRFLPWLTLGLTAVMLFGWSGNPDRQAPLHFVRTVAAFGLLYAGGAWLAMWGSPRPDRWAVFAGLSATGLYLLAYRGSGWGGDDLPWGLGAIGMGALYIAASWPVARRRASLPQGNASLAYLAAAATAFLSAAVPLELEFEWFAVAWSLELLALVWLAWRLDVPPLRRLAWPLAGLTALSLLGPWVLGYEIGPGRVFNWLLYGYGLPILAIAGGARFALRAGDRWLNETLQWLAIALGTIMLALQVRQGFHPGNLLEHGSLDFVGNYRYGLTGMLLAQGFDLIEASSYAIAWLLLALALLWAGRRWSLPVLPRACLGLSWLALASLLVGPVLLVNPLWAQTAVGDWPVLNRLLYAFGLPTLLIFLVARHLDEDRSSDRPPSDMAKLVGSTSLALFLLLLTLELRRAFHGSLLDRGGLDFLEAGSLGSAWLLLAIGTIWAGRRWRLPLPRSAGLFIIGLALVEILLLPVFALNPLWSHAAVGEWPIFNRLLPAYGLPALLCLAASRVLAGLLPRILKSLAPNAVDSGTGASSPARPDPALDSPVATFERQAARPLMAISLGLTLLLVTLEVRQLFQGNFLDSGSMQPAENYSYSLAWVIFGSLLLVLGVSRASRLLRGASLPVMLIAVGKVFLLDTASLGGLYRVLSFLGLGLSLMLLGWVYQRYVFSEGHGPAMDGSGDSPPDGEAWVPGGSGASSLDEPASDGPLPERPVPDEPGSGSREVEA